MPLTISSRLWMHLATLQEVADALGYGEQWAAMRHERLASKAYGCAAVARLQYPRGSLMESTAHATGDALLAVHLANATPLAPMFDETFKSRKAEAVTAAEKALKLAEEAATAVAENTAEKRAEAWSAGYTHGNDGEPQSWPDADTLPDYEDGHGAGTQDRIEAAALDDRRR